MITLTAKIEKDDGDYINLTKRNCISLSSVNSDRSDFELPTFGIISNSSSLSFIDSDESVRRLAISGKLKNGMKTEIFLQNTLYPLANMSIAILYTKDWKYDINAKKVSVTLTDGLTELQDIEVAAWRYDHTKIEDRKISFKKLYGILYGLTPQKYGFLPYSELDDETKAVLNVLDLGEEGYNDNPISNSDNRLDYLYWNSTNLWRLWNNFCQACFCHLYKYKGSTILKYNGGN